MIIDQHLLDELTAQAKASPRLRMNLNWLAELLHAERKDLLFVRKVFVSLWARKRNETKWELINY